MSIKLLPGDCRAILPTLPANSIDAIVTDPPYCLDSITKRFGSPTAKPAGTGAKGEFARLQRGFIRSPDQAPPGKLPHSAASMPS